jgi:hypothetical protein
VGATGSYSNPCAEATTDRTGSSTNPWHPIANLLHFETVYGLAG